MDPLLADVWAMDRKRSLGISAVFVFFVLRLTALAAGEAK